VPPYDVFSSCATLMSRSDDDGPRPASRFQQWGGVTGLSTSWLDNGISHKGDGAYTVVMTIPNGIPEDSSLYYMNQPATPQAHAPAAMQTEPRRSFLSHMNMTPEISHSIIKDAVMLILGSIAGVALFYAVTRSFDDIAGYAVFFGLGTGLPFGWRALPFVDSIINSFDFSVRFKGEILLLLYVLMLMSVVLYIIRFGLAVVLGVPVLFSQLPGIYATCSWTS